VSARARITPTTRTLAHLRAHGYVADIAERRQGPITRDLFGCIDVVAAHPERGEILFVQCTSNNGNGNFAARLAKTRAQPTTSELLRAGVRIEVWGWKNEDHEPRIERLSIEQPASGGA
jgi:hypothetical protein